MNLWPNFNLKLSCLHKALIPRPFQMKVWTLTLIKSSKNQKYFQMEACPLITQKSTIIYPSSMVLCMKLLVKKIQDDWVRSQKDKILPIVLLQNFPSRFFFEHYYRIPSNQSRQLLHQGRICLEKNTGDEERYPAWWQYEAMECVLG